MSVFLMIECFCISCFVSEMFRNRGHRRRTGVLQTPERKRAVGRSCNEKGDDITSLFVEFAACYAVVLMCMKEVWATYRAEC